MQQAGVGPVTALAFVLRIGPVSRFANGKKIVSYLGLNPSEESSLAHLIGIPLIAFCVQSLRLSDVIRIYVRNLSLSCVSRTPGIPGIPNREESSVPQVSMRMAAHGTNPAAHG
jgi:transposase IS116/IS110/IS902 family protein